VWTADEKGAPALLFASKYCGPARWALSLPERGGRLNLALFERRSSHRLSLRYDLSIMIRASRQDGITRLKTRRSIKTNKDLNMKNFSALICALAALTFSAIAHAAPVQYQLAGHFIGSSGPRLFDYGTPLTVTFTYDSTTIASHTNYPGVAEMSEFAPLSYYTGAINALYGSVLNYSFSSAHGDAQVSSYLTANNTVGEFPALFISTGYLTDPSSPANSSLQGFSIGESNLIGILGFAILNSSGDAPPNQQLPEILSLSNGQIYNIHLDLLFKSPTDQYSSHQRFYIDNITAVPLPNSALLFLSGLIGLGANIFRKTKS
jgi:hypothetical protein